MGRKGDSMNKKWYASRTLWANAIAFVVTIAAVFGYDLGLDAETQATLVAGIMSIVNIALRLDTSKALAK